jgi:hypothetical protein
MHKLDIIMIIMFIIILATFGFFNLKNNLDNNDAVNRKINEILNKEEPFIVADAEDFHNYATIKAEQLKEPAKFEDEEQCEKKCNKRPKKPKEECHDFSVKVVEDGLPRRLPSPRPEKQFMCPNDFGWEPSFPMISCSNSALNHECRTIPKKVLPYDINCDCPNVFTGENYFKSQLYGGECVKLSDYNIRGANYPIYSDYVSPERSNIRILSQNTKGLPKDQMKIKNIPTGYNYAFLNAPILPLP